MSKTAKQLAAFAEARKKRWLKKPTRKTGVNGAYGREIILQVPIGKHETRSMTIKQASVLYRHLRQLHWMLK